MNNLLIVLAQAMMNNPQNRQAAREAATEIATTGMLKVIDYGMDAVATRIANKVYPVPQQQTNK